MNNRGVYAAVNASWTPGDTEANTFFLAQVNVSDLTVNLNTAAEWIGWVIGRNPQLIDTTPRLYTEFFAAGVSSTGDRIGGWSPTNYAGFVPMAGAWVAVGDPVPYGPSTVNGTQFGHSMQIVYYPTSAWNCGTGCTGSWWLGISGAWVGHYPVGTSDPYIDFNRITSSAPMVEWYGEVYDPTPSTWTWTDMGSAQYASATSTDGQAGYFADLGYLRPSDNVWINSTAAQVVDIGGDDPNCYTRFVATYANPYWDTTMWFGGPGRTTSNGCDPF